MSDPATLDGAEPQGDAELLRQLQALIPVGDFVWSEDGLLHFRRVTEDISPIELDLPATGIGPFDLVDLFDAISLADIGHDVLANVPLHDGIYLTRLEMGAGASFDRANLFMSLAWPTSSWSPFPGVEFHAPSLSVSLSEGAFAGSVSGVMTLGGIDLTASLRMPEKRIHAYLSEAGRVSVMPLLEHFQMSAHGLEHLKISELSVSIDLEAGTQRLKIGLTGVWEVGDFEITDVRLDLRHSNKGDHGLYAELTGQAEIHNDTEKPVLIEVSAIHAGIDAGWQLEGIGQFPDAGMRVGSALGGTFDKMGFPLPDVIAMIALHRVSLRLDTKTKDVVLGLHCDLDVGGTSKSKLTTSFKLEHPPDGPTRKSVSGVLELANMEFDLAIASAGGASYFVGLYKNTAGTKIRLAKLINAASHTTAEMLGMTDENSGPSITLNDVLLVIESGKKNATIEIDKKTKFLFAMDADFGIDLSGLGDLPIIGAAMSPDTALGLQVSPVITSAHPPDLDAIESDIPDGGPFLPTPLSAGFSVQTTLSIAGEAMRLNLGSGEPDGPPASRLDITRAPPPAPVQPPPSDKIHWIELNKHFGPLAVDRVGLGLLPATGSGSARIAARIDAGLAAGPLTISLDGLGANIDIKSRDVSFALSGIGLMMKQGALEVSGAFLKMGDEFVGRATVKMEVLSLGALGAYGQTPDGHPSFFAYAFLDYPMGGPPFFFVEGLAFGFGYNRRLNIPDISRLSEFPLIYEVMMTQPPKGGLRAEMRALQSYIPADLDEYFLAVGVKFNSFKVLDGFALLSVSFGHHLEFDLIGETILQLPPKEAGAPVTLAKLIIPFSARYLPDEGFLAVNAEIAPGSFVYCPEVKLDGSMAFYSWFKGQQSGDFVFTIGGYHPDFDVPVHYPQQDTLRLLSFHWDIDSHFTVKGGLYYAMTPSAAMAGGMLDAQFHAGPLRAWFIMGLDLLIQWQPYHYTARAHVEIGASLSIDVPLIGSLRVTISASAEIELWGPELSGRAHVHTSVMGVSVGFDVSFIKTKEGDLPKLEWSEFHTAFLPKDNDVCSIAVTSGLVRTVKTDTGEMRVINPKEFALRTGSLVPSDCIDFFGHSGGLPQGNTPPDFGTGPMQQVLKPGAACHTVRVMRKSIGGAYDTPDAEFKCTTYRASYPAALWGTSHSPDDTLNTGTVKAIGGCDLVPAKLPKPGASSRIEREALDYAVTSRDLRLDDRSHLALRQVSAGRDWRAKIAGTLDNDEISTRRDAMLDDLGFAGAEMTATSRHIDDLTLPPLLMTDPDMERLTNG